MHPLRTAFLGIAALATGLSLAACGSSGSSDAVKTLTVTPYVSQQLLEAVAGSDRLPVSDFTGLASNQTYYAYDPADHLYWAAASVVPSASSQVAQVTTQDDGSYNLFTRTKTGWWTVYDDGLGELAGARCAIVTPKAVRVVWHWSLDTPCGGPPAP